jgi:Transcriptional regulatory protein, C terminal
LADLHYDNVRARFMTQFGIYSEATLSNDPSPAKGQWDLDIADRYIAEAYLSTRTVDNYVLRLRQKLERDVAKPVYFRTVHGMGYKLVR